MRSKKTQYIVGILIGLSVIVAFQNCSDVSFRETTIGDLGGPGINPLACNSGTPEGLNTYPSLCLQQPSFLSADSIGFQLSGTQMSKFSLESNTSSGISNDTFLYIEISTFSHPDSFVITYDTVSTTAIPLFNVCHLSTWNQAWLDEFQTERPFTNTIVQFGKYGNDTRNWIRIPAGTTKLHFDFTKIISASYIAVYNLNEFSTNLMAVKNPDTWRSYIQPAEAAPMPGDMNQSPDPINAGICHDFNENNIGRYACFSPGNFRYQASPLLSYNDLPGPDSDPLQELCQN